MKIMVYFNSMSAAGGIERVIASHIEFLSDTNKVTLVTKDAGPSFFYLPKAVKVDSLCIDFTMDMRFRWRRVLKIFTSLFQTLIKLRRQINKLDPTIVYVASPLNLLEVFLAGTNPRRILVTEHSSFSAYNVVYKTIIKILYPRVGLLMVPTKMDSQGYLKLGIRNIYVPNPLSFYPKEVSKLSTKLALCVGRLTPDKQHDLLLDIWHISGLYHHGWKLKIIGKGECESDLRKKMFELNLNDSVILTEPILGIQDEYTKSSIFLLTSRAEGFGLVLAEAMACGVPCICFDCPSGPRDIVENGATGRLLINHDVEGYVMALRELAEDSIMRQKYGQAARRSVKKFHTESVKLEFLKAFNSHFLDC